MKSRTRQREATEYAKQTKCALNFASHPDFIEDYGIWHSTGRPTSYVNYNHLGYEVRLRFSQDDLEWRATCPYFNITTTFPNQPPQDIQQILNEWLTDHLAHIATENDRRRMNLPAVQSLAEQHGVSQVEALEIYKLRGE